MSPACKTSFIATFPPVDCDSPTASRMVLTILKLFLLRYRRLLNPTAAWISPTSSGWHAEIAEVLKEYRVIVDKSTVPVKTGEKVAETIRRYNKVGVDFDVVSNPEFLREGCAVADLMNPDRIVVGSNSDRALALMKKVYEPFMAPIMVTDINSAELIKHAANSFLALKISYINAISAICEATGADVERVADGIGADKRIGRSFLNAGLGYGGSCFPKDVAAFIAD